MPEGKAINAAMEPIIQWLDGLGLGRYGPAFVAADIDPAVLGDLDEADLRQLGVTPGHRRRLLRAIAEFSEPPAPAPAPPNPQPPGAERRQLSVVFCDLVGSTALASRLDPEDLRELFAAYHRCCADVIGRLGGFVGKYMGDGVLAYFGYPHAGEDDPERAVAAGLELVQAARRITPEVALEVRVGVASGLVVVGDLIGAGAAREHAVVGDTPTLATYLQGVAAPGMVVIGPRTRRLLGRLFEYRELGPVALPGIAEPQPAFAVLRRSVVLSRFEARQDRELAGLIGRAAELDVLRARWREASAGAGRVVVLAGEPGMGKSRLAQAFQEWLHGQPRRGRARYYCSPLHQESALHPFVAQFERGAGFQHDDTPAQKRAKLDRLFDRAGTTAEDRTLITALALPGTERHGAALPAPEQRKRSTLDAIIRHIRSLARKQPLLLLFEDVQWIDPTSRELLDQLADIVPRMPALLLIATRPEFDASWATDSHVTTVAVGRLPRDECVALVGAIAGKALPASLVETIVERSDGVPLFLEEVTKAVLEAAPGAEPSASQVPTSLLSTLAARLDRLEAAKEIAQIGAVLGREFSYELLAAVAGRPDSDLRASLERLIAAGLLHRTGAARATGFLFKHALVQDAAYGGLLRSARREWHARIARTIASQFAETAQSEPALLARHYTEAGLLDEAITSWERAAERAVAHSANVECANHLKIALDLLARLPDSMARAEREVQLRLRLIAPLIATTGLASQRSEDNYSRIVELTEQAEASLELLGVLWGRVAMLLVRSDLDKAEVLAERFTRLAADAQLVNGRCSGHRLLGYTALLRGDIVLARRHFDDSLRDHVPEVRFVFADFPIDLQSRIHCQEALVLQQEGRLGSAAERAAEAIVTAKAVNRPASEGYVLMHVALLRMIAGDVQGTAEAATVLRELTDRGNLEYWRWHAEVMLGWIEAKSGELDNGLVCLRGGLELRHRYMANAWAPLYLLAQAELLIGHGRAADALPVLDDCTALMLELQQRYAEPELYRLRAIALADQGADIATVDAWFRRAIEIARARGMKLYELRAAACRAQFWQSAGHAEARKMSEVQAAHALLAASATAR